MADNVRDLIGLLEDMIENAKGLPLGVDKCLIERDRALEILEEIKTNLPTELDEARRLVEARTEYVNNAKREVEDMRRNAEERAKRLMDEQEIVKYAKAKSAEMLSTADKKSNELRRMANQYADDTMRRAEDALAETLDELRQARAKFRAAAGCDAAQRQEAAPEIDIDMDEA